MDTCFYCGGDHSSFQCVRMSTDNIASTIEESSSEIVEAIEESNYIISKQLSNVNNELVGIHGSIQELHGFLVWSHSEVIWRMEKQIGLLTGIHNMIENPRATQSNELYEMGIDSFKRNRLNDAQKLLLEARDLNPGDYRIHITLGHIFVRMDNLPGAMDCFQAAVDYARTSDYKKDALLLLCRVFRCLGQKDQAISTAKEASLIAPNYSPAHYELASCITEKLTGTASST